MLDAATKVVLCNLPQLQGHTMNSEGTEQGTHKVPSPLATQATWHTTPNVEAEMPTLQ